MSNRWISSRNREDTKLSNNSQIVNQLYLHNAVCVSRYTRLGEIYALIDIGQFTFKGEWNCKTGCLTFRFYGNLHEPGGSRGSTVPCAIDENKVRHAIQDKGGSAEVCVAADTTFTVGKLRVALIPGHILAKCTFEGREDIRPSSVMQRRKTERKSGMGRNL